MEECDRCGKPQASLTPTEKGWLCRECFSKYKNEFEEESEDAWWED